MYPKDTDAPTKLHWTQNRFFTFKCDININITQVHTVHMLTSIYLFNKYKAPSLLLL